jgi:hypothetical protein
MKKMIFAVVMLSLVLAYAPAVFAQNLEAPNSARTYEKCGSLWGMKFCVRATIDDKGVVRIGLKLPRLSWKDMVVKKDGCHTFAGWGLCVKNYKTSSTTKPPQWKASWDWYLQVKVPFMGTKKTSTFHGELRFP